MKYLYAPWRDAYFKKPEKGCIFCRASKSKSDDRNFVLERGEFSFVMLNLYPYTNAHIMAAPYRHTGDLVKLKPNETAEIMYFVQKSIKIFKKAFNCHGFNVGVNQGADAGAGFAGHIHFHVVGRWRGDTNFMTAVGSFRVIPSSVRKLYMELRKLYG